MWDVSDMSPAREGGAWSWCPAGSAGAARQGRANALPAGMCLIMAGAVRAYACDDLLMTSLPEIVILMCRADWTKLSLSADVQGGRILIAPGGRYRRERGKLVAGCDGQRSWVSRATGREPARLANGLDASLLEMLEPARLLSEFTLEYVGDRTRVGRAAHQLIATPRPGLGRYGPERVDIIVDAEFGIVLRREDSFADVPPCLLELCNLRIDPAEADEESQFAVPSAETLDADPSAGAPAGHDIAKFAASAAAAGLGVMLRNAPRASGRPRAEAAGAAMPRAESSQSGDPLTEELLYQLYLGGIEEPVLSGTAHLWMGPVAFAELLRSGADKAGIGGLRVLADAVEGRARMSHQVIAFQLGAGGRYRIERQAIGEFKRWKRLAKMTVCDGEHRWQVFDDDVTVGAQEPLRDDLGWSADLIDPSWLLRHRLSDQADAADGERAAACFRAAPKGDGFEILPTRMLSLPAHIFQRADVVVDSELGVISRLILHWNDTPVVRAELRDLMPGAAGPFTRPPAYLPGDKTVTVRKLDSSYLAEF